MSQDSSMPRQFAKLIRPHIAQVCEMSVTLIKIDAMHTLKELYFKVPLREVASP